MLLLCWSSSCQATWLTKPLHPATNLHGFCGVNRTSDISR